MGRGLLASVWGGGVGRAGLRWVGPRVGAAGRAALVPPLLGAGRWAGRTGVWGPSWYWVPLRARTSCLSAGSDSRRSSVLSARSASRSLVQLRSLVAAVCCLASCNGKVVSLRVPGLHSSVLRALRCSRDCLWRPGCRSWGPSHCRGCTPFLSAGLQTSSRRTPCLGVLCLLGFPLGFLSNPGPCRHTHGLRSLGCRILYPHILSIGCSVRCTPGSSVVSSAFEASVGRCVDARR